MSKPTPIDHATLPDWNEPPLECWQFNAYRAMDHNHPHAPVAKVWATRYTLYRSKPTGTLRDTGSRSIGTLYATEAEAWQACIAEVREWCDKRIALLEKMAKEPTP